MAFVSLMLSLTRSQGTHCPRDKERMSLANSQRGREVFQQRYYQPWKWIF